MHKSVALSAGCNRELQDHLLRPDRQEDVCLAYYRMSTGLSRHSALIADYLLPDSGDRALHGNVTISGNFIARSAERARAYNCGLVMLHSHPHSKGWQAMSKTDRNTEASFGNLVREITGLPFVGMTLAGGDQSWSARFWDKGFGKNISHSECSNVRVVGDRLSVYWNNEIVPVPSSADTQLRTISSWGEATQADLARLRVLIVGAGTVGLDLAIRLAATGLTNLTIMDFDIVKRHNLDRLIGASPRDAYLKYNKAYIAQRECLKSATALQPFIAISDDSVCESTGFQKALDADIIFSCVDRPWPRMVLNKLAYTDLIPVIDGGVFIKTADANRMVSAGWRAHVIRHSYPCLVCLDQLDPAMAALDRNGELDRPAYIANAPHLDPEANAQNVAALSVSVTSALLLQFIAFCATPGIRFRGIASVSPMDYLLSPGGSVDQYYRAPILTYEKCMYEPDIAGDSRVTTWTGDHPQAQATRIMATEVSRKLKILRLVDQGVSRLVALWRQ